MGAGFDYEGMAYEAVREGKVDQAQVWATLHQARMAEDLVKALESLKEAVHAIAVRP